jgi:hypothetical protein
VHLQVLQKDKVTSKLTGEFEEELKACNKNVQELAAENHKLQNDINRLSGVEGYEYIKKNMLHYFMLLRMILRMKRLSERTWRIKL